MMLRFLRKAFSRFRSAITGRFVSRGYAKEHPDTTFEDRFR